MPKMLAWVSSPPDGRDGMIQHAQEFHDAGIPFVFDPGQGLPMFDREELLNFIDLAEYAAMNEYEAKNARRKNRPDTFFYR